MRAFCWGTPQHLIKIQGMRMRLRANMFQGQAQEFTDAQVHTHTLLGQAPALIDSAYKKTNLFIYRT